jgi:hypothetical protein
MHARAAFAVFAAVGLASAVACGGEAGGTYNPLPSRHPTSAVALVSNCGEAPQDLRDTGLAARVTFERVAVHEQSGYVNAAPRAWVRFENTSPAAHRVQVRAFGECVIGREGGSVRSWCQEHELGDAERDVPSGKSTDYRIDADMRYVHHDMEVVIVSLMVVVDGKDHCVDAGAWVGVAQPAE